MNVCEEQKENMCKKGEKKSKNALCTKFKFYFRIM